MSQPRFQRGSSQRHQQISGDNSGGETPDPIPNSEVKPSRADGTAGGTLWESRSSPGNNLRRGELTSSPRLFRFGPLDPPPVGPSAIRAALLCRPFEHRQLAAKSLGDQVLEAIA